MAKFKYTRRTEEDWEKAAAGSREFEGAFKDAFTIYKARAGENAIRICPPTWEGARHYAYPIHVHFRVGPTLASVLCLRRMKNQRCPICEEAEALQKSGDEDSAKDLWPRKQHVAWIIDRKDESAGPLLYPMPAQKVDQAIVAICRDPETGELLYVDDVDQGYNLTFQKTGQNLNTQYTGFVLSRRPSAMSSDPKRQEQWEDFIHDHPIPDTLQWRSYDDVKRLFEGVASDEAEPARNRGNGHREPDRREERGQERERTERRETRREEREPDRTERQTVDARQARREPEREDTATTTTRRAPASRSDAPLLEGRAEPEGAQGTLDRPRTSAAALREKYAQRGRQADTRRERDLDDEIPY